MPKEPEGTLGLSQLRISPGYRPELSLRQGIKGRARDGRAEGS